jgi:hypothetical protein
MLSVFSTLTGGGFTLKGANFLFGDNILLIHSLNIKNGSSGNSYSSII